MNKLTTGNDLSQRRSKICNLILAVFSTSGGSAMIMKSQCLQHDIDSVEMRFADARFWSYTRQMSPAQNPMAFPVYDHVMVFGLYIAAFSK
jgi:hypothetical protein